MVMIMLQGQVELVTFSACARSTAVTQATRGTDRGHIAVATRQKSTARRLVSSILEGTYSMVFAGWTAVTTRSAGT
jgi:hypothetical protein